VKNNLSKASEYTLNPDGSFVIENYNESKPFSNFFPGIAGVWGIPMWVFYVNRGQCIASFGTDSKDHAIMEFQPANKAYRLTSLNGFRTFLKVQHQNKSFYWEPFQANLLGTQYKKKQTLAITAHDLTLEEINYDLGLTIQVNFFTLPDESYSALVRRVKIQNISKKNYRVELMDGLPVIVPFGVKDWANKNIARTVEAWVKVHNLNKKAPYFHLNVEVSDVPQVTHIKEGNFYFSFNPNAKKNLLLNPIVDTASIFGEACDFTAPGEFLKNNFKLPKIQQTSNRMPSAMSHANFSLRASASGEFVTLAGYAHDVEQLNSIVKQVTKLTFIDDKSKRNKELIDSIRNYAFTNSSSSAFNQYASYTFLDNVLRGGLPMSVKTHSGVVTFNVYGRKHGDLERDYNHFKLSPTFYSQGNGNYRDVNQNRRNDVWFNRDVGEDHLVNFLNLIQADGYNPLIYTGTNFTIDGGVHGLTQILNKCVEPSDCDKLCSFLKVSFQPGLLLQFLTANDIKLKTDIKNFLGRILQICYKQEFADHGEGFWTDHWTYNLDLIESYLSVYPENLKSILVDKKSFSFYLNNHYILPRHKRFILTSFGVRQYHSVAHDHEPLREQIQSRGHKLRTQNGQGEVYQTNLIGKLLCLIANKAATFDLSGVGIEMEADKPNWYDSLNGLPGLLGSSISETFELKRMCRFLLDKIIELKLSHQITFKVFEELFVFINGLSSLLPKQSDSYTYWEKSNELKEQYRNKVILGISGREMDLNVGAIKNFLELVIRKTDQAIASAMTTKDGLGTYFYHEVTEYETLNDERGKAHHVYPKKFKRHILPPFLEGYVHALRVAKDSSQAMAYYQLVRKSPLFDKQLKMYKVNADLTHETEEIGRTRIFPPGWLENQSIWLHMEYKFILELLRNGLYKEFYENFQNVLVPFLKPQTYGRNILENSSFIVSSAHEDQSLHGQGFVARLSGSTAEFIHMWLYMNVGQKPFSVENGKLEFTFKPVLVGWLFTTQKTTVNFLNRAQQWANIELPKNTYAFNFLGSTLVVYHNPKRKDTFGDKAAAIYEIHLTYPQQKNPAIVKGKTIHSPQAIDLRNNAIERVDVYLE